MTKTAKLILPRIAYPATMMLTLVGAYYLLGIQDSRVLGSYLPVFAGLALVMTLEYLIPNRREWRGNTGDVKSDFIFMALVQVLLPRLLALLAVFALIEPLQTAAPALVHGWPHGWPVGAQVALMLVSAEFPRYWLHRFAHTNPLLWRLHAVHHSVHKLYWLNVGRFHPLEKALQFLLDALPFMLLDVGEQVIALYFVFYAVNGFFQHSNIELRHGPLNYLISTAELHRWHHSRRVSEANNNYGNNLIIWDLVFGSWFLPKNRSVDELGLKNADYPMDFGSQMTTPFVRGITDKRVPLPTARKVARKVLLTLSMNYMGWRYWRPLRRALKQPALAQEHTLRQILDVNKHTEYGKQYGFAGINSVETFVNTLPIQEYGDLKPYVDQQIERGGPVITAHPPVLYAVTSGTTGSPKYLPVTPTSFHQLREAQRLILYHQFRQRPRAFYGQFLTIVSPAIEGHLAHGQPYGSASGLAYQMMPSLVRRAYIIPAEVFELTDYELKYALILRLALACENLTYIGTANPSSLLHLMALYQQGPQEYIDSIARGTFHLADRLPDKVAKAIAPRLQARPERANDLQSLLKDNPQASYAQLWPTLELVTTWTGGSCGIALNTLKKQLPPQAKVYELGYIASELRGTIPLNLSSAAGLPALNQHFFEFVEKNAWDAGERRTQGLGTLEGGAEYYLIVTTAAGLYRYFMNDILRVEGRHGATPLLTFVQKGRGVTNITGEKLYEGQVSEAMRRCEAELGLNFPFYILVADELAACYQLYAECPNQPTQSPKNIAAFIDRILGELNIEYRAKRDSGRLQPLHLEQLQPGAAEHYKQHHVAAGVRESQFKAQTLVYKRDQSFDFAPHLERSAH